MIDWARFPVPKICGDYINIYQPASDIYEGEDTKCYKSGQRYDCWLTNDFDVVKTADGYWHIIGITHPWPPGFINHFQFDETNVHEAESQLFHAVSVRKELKDCLCPNSFRDEKKLLYPAERPGERPECWAPDITRVGDTYHMIYSPQTMYHKISTDLYHWSDAPALFTSDFFMMRDPFVFFEDGTYTLIYIEEDMLYRTSRDFVSWSEPELFQPNVFGKEASQESPCIYKRGDLYYLLWCMYDGQNGCYDNRTFVYAAPSLAGLKTASPLTMLNGHATLMFDGEDGQTYVASAHYPSNGVNIAPIAWI